MPAPKSNPVRDRAVVLGRKMGCRGVVAALAKEGHVVGKTAVAEWIRADRARRAGKAEVEASRPPAPKKGGAPAKSSAKASSDADADDQALADTLAGVDPSALDFAELLKLDKEVTDFLRSAHKDEDEKRYAVLVRLKLDVRIALEKLRPAPKVDPDSDPMSLTARTAVFDKLKKMVTNAKTAARAAAAPPAPPPPGSAP